MKILVINGPNLNMLGIREPDIYGAQTLDALEEVLRAHCMEKGADVDFYQSNHEGGIIDRIQCAYNVYDGIILNPAAYTHTSIAIADAVKASASRRSKCTCRTYRRARITAGSPMCQIAASRRYRAGISRGTSMRRTC